MISGVECFNRLGHVGESGMVLYLSDYSEHHPFSQRTFILGNPAVSPGKFARGLPDVYEMNDSYCPIYGVIYYEELRSRGESSTFLLDIKVKVLYCASDVQPDISDALFLLNMFFSFYLELDAFFRERTFFCC